MAVEGLRLPPDRVDTIADFDPVKRFGIQSAGGADAATAAVFAELADLVARGELEVPIAGVFGLACESLFSRKVVPGDAGQRKIAPRRCACSCVS
jgi:hypothetical protein